ncbi:MAG: methyltransferase domain-containing protein [Chloroflexota bacterium]
MTYDDLLNIQQRPQPFARYTAADLWTDPHIAAQMLTFHLDPSNDRASRSFDFMDRSVAWLQDRFNIGAGTRIGDFGCGPGLYAQRLAALGAAVTGIDFSGHSLDYARKTAVSQKLTIDYIQANYLTFAADKQFDLILLISNDYCALSPAQRQQLLGIFKQHLAEGGAIVLDVDTLVAFDQKEEASRFSHAPAGGFWAADPYFSFHNAFKYPAERVTLDKFDIITPTHHLEIFNWMQHFDQATLAQEIAEGGLVVEAWYGDAAGAAFEEGATTMAVVMRTG